MCALGVKSCLYKCPQIASWLLPKHVMKILTQWSSESYLPSVNNTSNAESPCSEEQQQPNGSPMQTKGLWTIKVTEINPGFKY